MQSAGEPNPGRRAVAPSPRGTETNRTLVWFSSEAEQRRRAAAAARQAVSPPAAAGLSTPAAPAWRRPELFGCAALAVLGLAIFAGPTLNAAGMASCRTEPAALAPGAARDVRMTVTHGDACAVWAKSPSLSVQDVIITVAPQHGTLALRGRTGVTYRPARGYRGSDFFSFTLRSASAAGGEALTARVSATVQ